MLEIYTCEMYLLFCNRLADKLRLLAKQDMPAALRFSSQTQEFWQEYRSEEANVPLTPTQAETVKQLLSQNTPSEQEKKGAAGLYGLIFPVLPSARTFPNPRKGGKPSSDVPPLPLEAENLRRLDIFADRRLKELIAQEKQLASEMNTRKAGATRAK